VRLVRLAARLRRLLRWPHRHINGDTGAVREAAEARLRAVRRQTPAYERLASMMADLPEDDFARRVAETFRR
jgi:hypothetical protein